MGVRSVGKEGKSITVANDGKESEQFEDDDFKSIEDSPEGQSNVMWKRVEAPVVDLNFETNLAKNFQKKKNKGKKKEFLAQTESEDRQTMLSEALATESIRQGKSPSDWQIYEPRAGPVVANDALSVVDLPANEECEPSQHEDSSVDDDGFHPKGGPVPDTSLRLAVVLYQKPAKGYQWGETPTIGTTYDQELSHTEPLPSLTVGLKIPTTYPYYSKELLDSLEIRVEHIDSRVSPTEYYIVPPHRVHEFLIPSAAGKETKKRLKLVYSERLKKKVLEDLPTSDRDENATRAAPTPPRPPSRVQ